MKSSKLLSNNIKDKNDILDTKDLSNNRSNNNVPNLLIFGKDLILSHKMKKTLKDFESLTRAQKLNIQFLKEDNDIMESRLKLVINKLYNIYHYHGMSDTWIAAELKMSIEDLKKYIQ